MVGAANARVLRAALQVMLLGRLLSRRGKQRIVLQSANPTQKDLAFLSELLVAGRLIPVVERTYPLCETAEAMRYLEKGHPGGKVVITV